MLSSFVCPGSNWTARRRPRHGRSAHTGVLTGGAARGTGLGRGTAPSSRRLQEASLGFEARVCSVISNWTGRPVFFWMTVARSRTRDWRGHEGRFWVVPGRRAWPERTSDEVPTPVVSIDCPACQSAGAAEGVVGSMEAIMQTVPWNKGHLTGQKRPLKPKDVWAIRVRLQLEHRGAILLFSILPSIASSEVAISCGCKLTIFAPAARR